MGPEAQGIFAPSSTNFDMQGEDKNVYLYLYFQVCGGPNAKNTGFVVNYTWSCR